MLVTYLGHAAIMLEAGGSRILMDPWLVDPSYDGTWWHFPPLALGVRDLPRIDYLFVSHEHPDHFDPPTLQQLDKNTHVIIADFRKKVDPTARVQFASDLDRIPGLNGALVSGKEAAARVNSLFANRTSAVPR